MSFLKQYDQTPVTDQFKLLRHWMDNSPLPLYEELRKDRPILETSICTLLTRFDDCVEVLRLPTVFTVELYVPKMGDYMLAQDETPLHNREKAIMSAMLNREDLPNIRKLVGEWSKKILDEACHEIELVNKFARIIPCILVQEYFGFNGVSHDQLIRWSYWSQYNSFHNQPFDLVDDPEQVANTFKETSVELKDYISQLIPKYLVEIKAGIAKDTIVARLLRTEFPPEVGFPMTRLGRNIGGLLIGAIETTSQAVTQIVQELLRRPDVLKQAVTAAQAGDDALFDAIVWEALRYNPITPYIFRKAASDYTVAKGTPRASLVKKGTLVLAATLSGTFDETSFPEPNSFNPQRPWYNYFHFGFGHHECLGKYVGMVMIPEMVKQLIIRPGINAPDPIDFQGKPLPEHYVVKWQHH